MNRVIVGSFRPSLVKINVQRPLLNITKRSFAAKADETLNLVAADQSMAAQKIFHKSSLASLVLTPVAIGAYSAGLAMPVDVCLSVLFPLHAHIGMSWIFTDYLPGHAPNGGLRMAMAGATALTILGLLKLSITGDGLVGTLAATWKDPKDLKKE